MADLLGNSARARRIVRLPIAALTLLGAGFSLTASAGSFDLFGVDTDYKLTLGYAVAVRTKDPDPGLINGPLDPFQSEVRPPGQIIGFTHTGLPNTANFDDGDRNFKKFSLIDNRLSAYGELNFAKDNYGAVFSGSYFYDQVYHEKNDNTQLQGRTDKSTVNTDGAPNEFTEATKHYAGNRARLLEAYAYGDWDIGEQGHLNVRAGKQLVAWGESLFFSGVALAQGPADAGKAFVPGAEVKDILLPVNQVALRVSLNDQITLLGQYKLEFKPTELFATGSYFSPADLIGPGATFGYGSVNPAYASQCVGLLKFGPIDLSAACQLGGGIGGPLLGADPYIYVERQPDEQPGNFGQYGIGMTAQVTPAVTMGLYRLHYADTNPAVDLKFGFPTVLTIPTTVTTEAIGQPTPIGYAVKYYGGIDMTAVSASTALGPFNIAGELIYRQNQDVQVKSIISGVLSPIYTTGNLSQALLSTLYVSNPGVLVDDIAWVTEAGIIHVNSVDPIPDSYGMVATTGGPCLCTPTNGMLPAVQKVGNGGEIFNDRTSSAIQTLVILGNHNVISGWDLKNQISGAMIIKGNPPMSGVFGSLIGEGDKRLSLTTSMTYLSNLEFSLGYNFFFGNPDKRVNGDSPVEQNPYSDRDYATFTVKYNL